MWSSAVAAFGTVGSSFIDAVVGLAVERVYSKLADENLQFDHEFRDLKNELRYMMSFLKDVEQVKRNQRMETLKTIIADIREFVYEAEDIIDDYNLQVLTQSSQKLAKASTSSSASSLNVSNKLKQQLQKINESIKKVKDRLPYFGIALSSITSDKDWINKPLCYPILSNEDELVGLKDNLRKIMQWFPVENEPFRVIGIVGMGGIGKTTLAQKIYDEAKSRFRRRMFVTVSQNFELEDLIRSILRKLSVPENLMKGDARDLQEMLKSKLDEKYLIVLDDVWSVTKGRWWDSLRSALPPINGSCVIVTTRKEEVAKSMGAIERYIHRPELLSNEDCWSLFSKTAFQSNGGHCPNESLREIGKEIVSKCGRLPLAIKIMGGMMLAKGDSIQKWRQVLEQLKEGFAAGEKDEVLISTLELSYEELPAHLKPCLLCFAAYPEDAVIDIDEMIYWWIGEEFVSESAKKTALDLGKEWFMELVNQCLIIGVQKDIFEEGYFACKVHDIVREMIINIARAENFIDMHGRCTSSTGVPSRRVCITTGAEEDSFKPNSKLRTLLLKTDVRDWNRYRCDLSRLRIIYSIRYADWMSSSRHLTYLHLSDFRKTELPDSFGSLQCLRVLRVHPCNRSLKFPSSLKSLKKLRVFSLSSVSIRSTVRPRKLEGVENLSSLHRLNLFWATYFEETKGLKQLIELRELTLHSMTYKLGETLKALVDLPQLKILKINASLKQVCDLQLSPFKRLEELHLCFQGMMPAWITPITFPNLRLLNLGSRERGNYPSSWELREPNFSLCESLWSNRNVIWTQLEALVLKNDSYCHHRFSRDDISQMIESTMPSLRLLKRFCDYSAITGRKQNGVWSMDENVGVSRKIWERF